MGDARRLRTVRTRGLGRRGVSRYTVLGMSDDVQRIETRLRNGDGVELFVRAFEHARSAAYALVLVHGTAGHGGCYESFASKMAAHGCNVYAFDLTGHGLSGGSRGNFTFEGFLADVDAVSRWVSERTGLPVVLLGAS